MTFETKGNDSFNRREDRGFIVKYLVPVYSHLRYNSVHFRNKLNDNLTNHFIFLTRGISLYLQVHKIIIISN